MKNIDVYLPLTKLGIDKNIIEKLENKNVKTINDLWVLKRKELKDLDFNDKEINHIRIKLQLWGLDLNKKIYI